MLTNVLYNKQSIDLKLNLIQFQYMIEEANLELTGFFSSMPVTECPTVPVIFNGISVHNSNTNVERQLFWISEEYQNTNSFDRIELLTIHSYNNTIAERKYKRSMKEYVAPIVANWPGQLFIRKALTHLHTSRSQIPKEIDSFILRLGSLHLSLNSRKHVMIIYHFLFEKMFHFVFGEWKKLAKKPKSWRINLLLELMQNDWIKIKDVIMQKFGLACKDIEYQTTIDLLNNLIPATLDIYAILFCSAPLVFLSDIFYCQIRANTSPNATVKNIIKQAYVIGVIADHDPIFKDVYCKTCRYLYSSSTFDFLSNKTSFFLLKHFCSIFHNQNNSIPIYSGGKKKKLKGYKLTTLEKEDNLDDKNNEEEKEESSEEPVNEQANMTTTLKVAINNINYW
ncbi:hypothetical protein C1646_756485 [Rhizophagus diaphanus]|nr:hypothetical protein C1646_756485 [Rhizophagus diaphanus] [Rhizophagus sp. MUCL 43196]